MEKSFDKVANVMSACMRRENQGSEVRGRAKPSMPSLFFANFLIEKVLHILKDRMRKEGRAQNTTSRASSVEKEILEMSKTHSH